LGRRKLTSGLTIRKNCYDEVKCRFGVVELASDIWKELKKAFEGKTVTEYYTLLGSINNCPFDDRITTIDAYITEYERRWNSFSSISRASINDDNFGKGLVLISKSEQAKAEFLL
jgi:hypothetical protein